jgi:hypothetical protein
MPAQVLDDKAATARKYDVAGCDSPVMPNFVRHVGLFLEGTRELRRNDCVPLAHMGPPLEIGNDTMANHNMGTAGLKTDEVLQVQVFIDDRAAEYEAGNLRRDKRKQYCVAPHAEPFEETDGTVTYWKFSCAGFVIEAYRFAGLNLLITDEGHIPPIGIGLLNAAYPGIADNPCLRTHFKLHGSGPWNVVLAGYVLNALDRSVEAIRRAPYRPVIGDAFFPARRT